MKMKRGWTRYHSYRSSTEESHYLEVWTQPYHRWLIGQAYTAYDKLWWKNPIGKWISNRVDKLRGQNFLYDSDWKRLPWSVKRDLRQDDLVRKDRTTVLNVPVTEEQFDLLIGHDE